jgi:hypothetical protein
MPPRPLNKPSDPLLSVSRVPRLKSLPTLHQNRSRWLLPFIPNVAILIKKSLIQKSSMAFETIFDALRNKFTIK